MKKIITILFSSFVFLSCSSPTPDDTILAEKVEKGSWVFDSTLNKNVQKDETYYLLSPTMKQSFYYASKRGDRKLLVGLSLVCLTLAVVTFLFTKSNRGPEFLQNGLSSNLLMFVFLAGALALYLDKPLEIRWNNEKWVTKQVYEKAMETGSTKPIWDSLETNCQVIDGPYNCYK